jgi:pyruvate carboxylase
MSRGAQSFSLARLRAGVKPFRIHFFPTLRSTNDHAAAMRKRGDLFAPDPEDPDHLAAPMPGKVSTVAVKKGQAVKAGERLLSIEAMKIETAVYCPRDAKVADVLVKPGSIVAAQDLLVTLEG